VVLTRASADNARLRAALGELPAELIDYPCIETEALALPSSLVERVRGGGYVSAVFVSKNAVEHLFASVHGPSPREVIALGRSTAEALDQAGWSATALPSEPTLETAIRELDRLFAEPGRILYVRGDLGEDTLPEALRAGGREVDVAIAYRTRDTAPASLPPDARPTLVAFASPSAVRHFVRGAPSTSRARALAIGPTTATAAREAGFEVDIAPSPDVKGLAISIRHWVHQQLSAASGAL